MSSPAARCIGARTTATRRRTRCSIISGRRFPSFQGETQAKADHPARSECLPSGGDLPRADRRYRRSRACRGIQDGLVVRAQAGQDHDDRARICWPPSLTTNTTTTRPRMMADFGKLLHQNFKKLAEAGCKHHPDRRAVFHAVQRRRGSSRGRRHQHGHRGLPDDVHVMVHICQGNYAVGPDYDGQIGHRYFDTGRYKADLVCQIECDGYLIEHDMTPHYEGRSATSSSASAPSTCRRRMSRPASKSRSASRPTPGSRPNRPSSPAHAASIICRGTLRSASCGR